ncbi:putative glycoside hydrolase [Zobellia galactanivorans]|uniref:putative glycoside hydrolase n=1 Tax=Zobellia galactanivorans (strain DSM 12802 / CCUG 47099 / CIP 106680 / NCIMB 13871 / Dsij) TaxID=63186 RepID=UPI0026E26AE0|nr:putative glycoside hydrolase [Zobellia galactanivorans]MDO6809769.1 putative glycoside hydrolase [Zobellia galactanivorans]
MENKTLFRIRFQKSLGFVCCFIALGWSAYAQKASSLPISTGSTFKAKAYFPEFSWDTTPMYYHFGDIDRVLEPEEVDFIADRTDFISIEKSHAFNALGDAVLGTRHEVEAFHKRKPEAKVLFYYNSYVAWPFTRFNKDLTPEGIAKNKDRAKFLAVDPKTGKFLEKTNGPAFSYYFDALNPEFREWWVASAIEGIKISGADGVFIDRMNVDENADYHVDDLAELAKAKGEMMAALKERIPDKILVGNNAARTKEVFPHCDAFMFEHYNATVTHKENLLKEWEDMVRIAEAGKISIYRFGAKGRGKNDITLGATKTGGIEQKSKEQLEFYHACFLIGAQPYSYFQWNWGWNLEDGNLVDYPALQKPLGKPKGAFKREEPDGWVFTREFEHARVWVDTEARKAKITWH